MRNGLKEPASYIVYGQLWSLYLISFVNNTLLHKIDMFFFTQMYFLSKCEHWHQGFMTSTFVLQFFSTISSPLENLFVIDLFSVLLIEYKYVTHGFLLQQNSALRSVFYS